MEGKVSAMNTILDQFDKEKKFWIWTEEIVKEKWQLKLENI
ncbi:hypothetical protein COLO4_19433 [Corchorus olitorius]|uniref:Uncharacterized protein n=1 Tax=Corchorus olitorius TaxID=93759 RepID=A0A1R3J5B8_9ROSI|nr:hypothetical protein COLO4_19433 [Corchorus olitorius]